MTTLPYPSVPPLSPGHVHVWRVSLVVVHAANFDLKSPRPWPGMRQDPAKRAAYLEALGILQEDPTLDLWYGDETGIEGDPKLRRRWAEKGAKTTCRTQGILFGRTSLGQIVRRLGSYSGMWCRGWTPSGSGFF
jgi:hypothetical protein